MDSRYISSELLRKVPTTAVYGQVGNDNWVVSEPHGAPSLRSKRDNIYPVISGGSVSFQNNSLFISPYKGEKMDILVLVFWYLDFVWNLDFAVRAIFGT
jgi:hypothetical protein